MAFSCSRLASIESLEASCLLTLAVLAGFFFGSLIFEEPYVNLADLGAAALAFSAALVVDGFGSTFSGTALLLSLEAALVASVDSFSLSLRASASDVVKFLSKEEPFVTINFYLRT